ncbi:sigma-70 region 4 domain-containing protein [Streptomyces tubbatahanensis]|uniref:Sigma-70 region 4 domain-containing protein n=1 Tax=Streptomyces tubbatahanensis TaxID=2923272 RepID=A0ABY3Y2R0_9ACTN|nr:sigma-70 region 4 domain-containing protein [Streptomyces tubbatahanensis]UNT00829.1 sigma-70 region 4 domain-containing protein [Streptomyces tubbatahanensis]
MWRSTGCGGPSGRVLLLCVWAGLDYAEAAEALGVPVGTVRSRLSRARAAPRAAQRAGRRCGAAHRHRKATGTAPRVAGEGEGGAAFASLPLREDTL